ncbi:MAG TPA: hypothetical protein VGI16_16235 [Candidatus Acidoferrum sp.]
MSFHYSVFGLLVRSNLPLPDMTAANATEDPADLEIYIATSPFPQGRMAGSGEELVYVSSYTEESGEPSLRIWGAPEDGLLRLAYCDGTQFWLDRNGTELWACWSETTSLANTFSYLLGPVLGLLMRLRGVICLHASAVAFGDYSVAFVGAEGAGKSTTAAAFAREGHGVISDDVVALVERDGVFHIMPAYPHVRLWPESVTMLYGSADALPPFMEGWDKRRLELRESTSFEKRILPLGAVYLLGEREGPAAAVTDVPAQTGFLTLVANTYATNLLDKEKRGQEFAALGRLMGSVPIRQVCAAKGRDDVGELCRVVRADFEELKKKV